jgi:hypothetical protein
MAIVVDFGDAATCAARAKLSCSMVLNAAGSSLTPQVLDDCAKALSGVSCEDLLNRKPPAACRPKPGSLANGVACGIDNQCQGGYCKTNGECGVCSARAAAGGSCEANQDCDYGLDCANKVCVTAGGPGAICDTTHPCRADLSCAGGACATPLGPGAKCINLKHDCEPEKGYYCHPTNLVCTAVKQAKLGEACGALANNDYALCVSGSKCSGVGGTCMAPLADGATCALTGPGCQAPASCVDGLCKISDPSTCK